MRMILGFGLSFMAGAVLAGDFWHPDAAEVVVAGPEPATVCYYSGTNVGPAPGSLWDCAEYDLFGAREPVYILLPTTGPVKVMGARWAYAWDGANWVPMAKD